MNKKESKHSSIYAVAVMSLSEANVNNVPGLNSIRVQGIWDKLPASQIEFTEKSVDGGFDTMLKIVITNTSQEMHQQLTAISSIDVICRLYTTDCMDRVVGSDDCPLRFQLDRSGQPMHYTLVFRGVIPECCKLLQSF